MESLCLSNPTLLYAYAYTLVHSLSLIPISSLKPHAKPKPFLKSNPSVKNPLFAQITKIVHEKYQEDKFRGVKFLNEKEEN